MRRGPGPGHRRPRPARLGDWFTAPPAVLGLYVPVYVFVAALPHARACHRERGVVAGGCQLPADVARRTLADLGRTMPVHHRRHRPVTLPRPAHPRLRRAVDPGRV
ncbi:acyltransferase domain-containing protein [Streptomyces sp. NPDC004752]